MSYDFQQLDAPQQARGHTVEHADGSRIKTPRSRRGPPYPTPPARQ